MILGNSKNDLFVFGKTNIKNRLRDKTKLKYKVPQNAIV